MNIRTLCLPFLLLAVMPLRSAQPLLNADRYHNPDEINRWLHELADANRQALQLQELAVSPGGQPLLLVEIGPAANGRQADLPAVIVVANLEGTNVLASEAALRLIRNVLENETARRDRTWYILPLGNPDATWRYFRKPLNQDTRNGRPLNDDMDDRSDEDGNEDLNGDGWITQMRVPDLDGEWLPVAREPRLLKRADWSRGEKGAYKLYSEGIDNDGDGSYNEDGPGGVNPGINFPHLFKPFTATGGPWAGSENETSALIRFISEHPEIALSITLGESNFCLTPPRSDRRGDVDFTRIHIPKHIAVMFNVEADKTYTMAEIMDMARGMAPPGFELTEAMVASFLELGAVVNPLPEDMKFYRELSEQYKEFLKAGKLDEKRLEPAADKDGSFELWAYYHLGLPSFSLDFWTPPEAGEEKADSSGITPEQLEKMSNADFVALGETKISAFLQTAGAPPDMNAGMVLKAVQGGMMTTKRMADMLRQMPKPRSPEGVDPREKTLLAYSDRDLGGKGFVAWKPFRHPVLGDVEIGGFVPFLANTPPPAMIEKLLTGQVPWILKLAEKTARLHILHSEVNPLGGSIYKLKVWVENSGYLPYPTAMGRRNNRIGPAVVALHGTGFDLLQGRRRALIEKIPGNGRQAAEWLVHAENPVTITVQLTSMNAGHDSRQIRVGGGK